MKKYLLPTIFLALTIIVLPSCRKNYYGVDPTPPVTGYQYIFDDNFDYDSHNWSFNDHYNSAFVDIGGGMLNYTYTPAQDGTNTVAVNTGANLSYDFLIRTSISSDNAMGIAFGVSNTDYGYSLMIDDQGYFCLYREGDANNAAQPIIDWQQNSAIRKGWNDVELEQRNGYWVAYANGSRLFEVAAQRLLGDKIGFIVLANTRGSADYLTVKY
jgi:hypothetical protein